MSTTPAQVKIPDSENKVILSTISGEEYQLFISLPRGYATSNSLYPVLYLLDGDQFFGMLTDIVHLLQHRDRLPEMVIVGIGYSHGITDLFERRIRDFSPSQIEQLPFSGGGDKFMALLLESVLPLIEQNYQVDPAERTLCGASIAGLFALNVLLDHPEVFRRCIVSSPSLFWDNGLIFAREQTFAQIHKALPITLFLSVGELEDPTEMLLPIHQFAEVLTSRGYAGLQLQTAVIPGESHFSVQPAALTKGLKAVFVA